MAKLKVALLFFRVEINFAICKKKMKLDSFLLKKEQQGSRDTNIGKNCAP